MLAATLFSVFASRSLANGIKILILIPANINTQLFGRARRRLECQIKYPLMISGYLIWHSKRLRARPND